MQSDETGDWDLQDLRLRKSILTKNVNSSKKLKTCPDLLRFSKVWAGFTEKINRILIITWVLSQVGIS